MRMPLSQNIVYGDTEIDWAAVEKAAETVTLSPDDAPHLTDEILQRARPALEVLYEIFDAPVADVLLKRPGRPKASVHKEQITLRLSPVVLQHFRAQGRGWQTRIDEALKTLVSVT